MGDAGDDHLVRRTGLEADVDTPHMGVVTGVTRSIRNGR